jgi:epoxyqueuosine reductase
MTGEEILEEILNKALDLGASMAGSVPAENLRDCPSAQAAGPQGFRTFSGTIIVLGLYHDPDKPEMDWWEEGKGTPGDHILRTITRELSLWLTENHGIEACDIPYQIYDGGIYLKDAAVMAGLGSIGRNNLVITPEYGPSVRFRALWVDIDTEQLIRAAREPPCDACDHPCETQCPQNALEGGTYSRERCLARMDADKTAPDAGGKKGPVDHCRICELVCPGYRRR